MILKKDGAILKNYIFSNQNITLRTYDCIKVALNSFQHLYFDRSL